MEEQLDQPENNVQLERSPQPVNFERCESFTGDVKRLGGGVL